MTRRVARYTGRVVLTAILLVLLALVGIDLLSAFIDELGKLSDSYRVVDVGWYVLLTLPGRLYEFTPYACLVGALLGLGQLASSSELVVMRAVGLSRLKLVSFAAVPALMLSLLMVLMGEYLVPVSERIAQAHRALAQSGGELRVGRHGLWNRDGNTFMHLAAVRSRGTASGVTLLEFDEERRLKRLVNARDAVYQEGFWMLEQVSVTEIDAQATRVAEHDVMRWDTRITPDLLAIGVLKPENLSIQGLRAYSRYLRAQGLDAKDYALALWRKLALPLAVLSLVIVATAFVFGPLRDGSLGLRLVLGVVLGIVFRTSQDLLGPASMVFGFAPVYAVMLPIGACLLLGVLLLQRAP